MTNIDGEKRVASQTDSQSVRQTHLHASLEAYTSAKSTPSFASIDMVDTSSIQLEALALGGGSGTPGMA